MFQQLQEWSIVICIVGGIVLNRGAAQGDAPSIVAGGAVSLIGFFLLVYKRWYNLSWLAVIVGGTMVLYGAGQRSAFLGRPIEIPNTYLIGGGAVLAIVGLICFIFLYRECSRRDRDCSRLGHGPNSRP